MSTIEIDPMSQINLPADSSYLFSLADQAKTTSLTGINGAQYLNTAAVTNMQGMFSDTSINPDISTWNTAKVTNFAKMFQYNQVANPDVSRWNVASALNFSYMFNDAKSARPNTAAWENHNFGVDFSHMFEGCPTDLINLVGLIIDRNSRNDAAFFTEAPTNLVAGGNYDGIFHYPFWNTDIIRFTGNNYGVYNNEGILKGADVETYGYNWEPFLTNGVVSTKKPVLINLSPGSSKTGQAPTPGFTITVDGSNVFARDWVEGSLSTAAADYNLPGSYPVTMGDLRLKADKEAEYVLVPINTASWEITGIKPSDTFIEFGQVDTTKIGLRTVELHLCNTSALPQSVLVSTPKGFTVDKTILNIPNSDSIDCAPSSQDQTILIHPEEGLVNGSYTGDLIITPEQGDPIPVHLHVEAIGKERDTKVEIVPSQTFTTETEELIPGTLSAKVSDAPQGAIVKWYKYDESSYSSNWVEVEDATGDKLPVKVTNVEQKYRVNVEKTQGGILATTDFTVPKGKAMKREVTLTPDAALSGTLEVGASGVLTAKVTNPPASKLTYKWYVTEPNSYYNQEYTTEVATLKVTLNRKGDYSYKVQAVNELGTVIGESKLELSNVTPPSLTVDSNPNNLDQYAATQQVKVTYSAGENGPEEVIYRWTVDGKAIDQTTDNALINRDKQAHEVKVEAVANGKVVASATTTVPARQVRKLTNVHVNQQTVDDKVVFTPEFNPVTYKVEPGTVKYTWTVGSKKYEGNQYSTLTLDKAALEGVTFVGFNADSDFLQASGSTTYSADTTPTDNGSGNETPDNDTDNNGTDATTPSDDKSNTDTTNTTGNSGTDTATPSDDNNDAKTGANSGSTTGTALFITLVVILAILGAIGAASNGAANNLFRR